MADAEVGAEVATLICAALRVNAGTPIVLPAARANQPQPSARASGETPRQLVGQPAAHGLATGSVRVIRSPQDLGGFHTGEVLVCDAIQPMMTHLVPLAAAVVERRGGMLIHGAIIARELGIPCVNGVAHAVDLLQDGDCVTVDGYLGIVTIGAPEFRLELGVTENEPGAGLGRPSGVLPQLPEELDVTVEPVAAEPPPRSPVIYPASMRNGVPIFPRTAGGPAPGLDLVNKLRDETP